MKKRYFNKITVVGHLVEIDDDEKVLDLQTPENELRTLDDLTEFFAQIQTEVMQFNAEQPNRKQRRS